MSIELKELWKNEALNFIPWLAKSGIIEEIIDELNIFNNPLKLYKTEHKIGNYRIDMTYQTLDKKNSLIVENQFGLTDSKHLGQNIIYSSLTNIPNILWIADNISTEHKKIDEILKINIILCSVKIHKVSDRYKLVFSIVNKNKDFIFTLDNSLNRI